MRTQKARKPVPVAHHRRLTISPRDRPAGFSCVLMRPPMSRSLAKIYRPGRARGRTFEERVEETAMSTNPHELDEPTRDSRPRSDLHGPERFLRDGRLVDLPRRASDKDLVRRYLAARVIPLG